LFFFSRLNELPVHIDQTINSLLYLEGIYTHFQNTIPNSFPMINIVSSESFSKTENVPIFIQNAPIGAI